MDEAVLLARAQFGLNIAFHILFPSLSIGLGWVLVYLKTRAHFCAEKRVFYTELSDFLIKVFAITFALGAASGIVMSFQFGTNWPGFMKTVGEVAGPLLSFEILSAFFLEATFLGILLFGKNKVPTWALTTSAWIVALGTTLSAFWILSLNSWMHTPAGVELVQGQVVVKDWMQVIFNPSFPYRLTHMLMACLLTALFFVMGLFALRFVQTQNPQWAVLLKRVAPLALVLAIAQATVGDMHGLNTLKHQPWKIAAIEGLWETKQGAPLLLFALPDNKAQENTMEFGIPKVASLILTHDPNGELKGLKEFEHRPDKIGLIFWSFRIMVATGLAMIAAAAYLTFTKAAQRPNIVHRGLVGFTFAGWIAILAGWLVTEIGRQPWLVTGILKTQDAAGSVALSHIQLSFASYLAVYAACLGAYLVSVFFLFGRFKPQSLEAASA